MRSMEPVDNIKGVQKERWELLCCLCKQRMGAKIQCVNCYTAYHPLCARMAGGKAPRPGPARRTGGHTGGLHAACEACARGRCEHWPLGIQLCVVSWGKAGSWVVAVRRSPHTLSYLP